MEVLVCTSDRYQFSFMILKCINTLIVLRLLCYNLLITPSWDLLYKSPLKYYESRNDRLNKSRWTDRRTLVVVTSER